MRARLPKWMEKTLTIDEAMEQYRRALAATGGRTEKIRDGAAQARDERIARAERALERERAAAVAEYEAAVSSTTVARERTAGEATRKFDEAAAQAVGVGPEFWVRQAGQTLELRHGTGGSVLATATNRGSAGWTLDGGPGGRQFLAAGNGVTARAGLWRIAGQIPAPVR